MNYKGHFARDVLYNSSNETAIVDGNGGAVTGRNHIAHVNPLRYRGYYYDSDTGYYYLQSRYYDPEMGRFISADAVLGANEDVLEYNLFAYCSNDPVKYVDVSGYKKSVGSLLSEYNSLTPTEKRLVVLYPKEAYIVKSCAKQADIWTNKYYRNWKDGDVGNAFRHAIWNAFMTQAFWSRTNAKIWADAHEAWPDSALRGQRWNGYSSYQHRDMDYYNNRMGREAVQWYEFYLSGQQIANRILKLVRNRKLRVLVR